MVIVLVSIAFDFLGVPLSATEKSVGKGGSSRTPLRFGTEWNYEDCPKAVLIAPLSTSCVATGFLTTPHAFGFLSNKVDNPLTIGIHLYFHVSTKLLQIKDPKQKRSSTITSYLTFLFIT